MDVELGPQEGAAHMQGGELLTISTDGIEVFMPSKIAQAMRDIQTLDDKVRTELRELRKEVRSKKDAATQEQVNWLREVGRDESFEQLAKTYRAKATNHANGSTLDKLSREEKNTIFGEHIGIYMRKRREFEVKLNQAVIKCKKNSSFYFHIVFFVFDSANLAEIADYSLSINDSVNKKLSGEQHTKRSEIPRQPITFLPDELFVSIDCEMDAKSVIDRLNHELGSVLAPFKSMVVKGGSSALPETCSWVTILFQTQFYLSQIDMDTVLQFLAQEHFTPQLRFILVFKKLKDAESLTPGKKCMLYQEPIEKYTNYAYEFFNTLIAEDDEIPRTHMPPSLLGNLIQYHEDYRFHVSTVISHLLGLLSLHFAHCSLTSRDSGFQEEAALFEKVWKAGIGFFNKLISQRAVKISKDEEVHLLIIQNKVQFYADPKIERFPPSVLPDSDSKAGLRFRMADLALAFMETDGEYLDRLLANCQLLISEYEAYTNKLRKSAFNTKFFVDKVQCIITKVKKYKDAKKQEHLPKNDPLFDRKKIEKHGPKDAQERANQLIQSTQANPDSQIASGDQEFVNEVKLELAECLEEVYTRMVRAPIESLSVAFPHKVLSNHRDFEAVLNPKIVEKYIRHLRRIATPKPATERKSSSAESRLNVAELATKVMFELFANGPLLVQVEELIGPFASRMQQTMGRFGIRFQPVQDSSMLSQQASSLGGASSREAQIQLGVKYLFYYAINTLKRAGLIEEFNKSKRVVRKRFFKEISFLDNS